MFTRTSLAALIFTLFLGLVLSACSTPEEDALAELETLAHKTRSYSATLGELNNSGARGKVTLVAPKDGGPLRVNLNAHGLLEGVTHLQHIHGAVGGTGKVCPPPSADSNGDGFVDLLEGAPFYGGILVTLGTDDSANIAYSRTFTETDSGNAISSIYPVSDQHIVVHGVDVDGDGDLDGQRDVNGDGEIGSDDNPILNLTEVAFELTLPALCGEISANKR